MNSQPSARKLFVANFPFSVDNEKLKEHFSKAGTVVTAKVVTEGEGGRSRGFGFVEMASPDEATQAIKELDGTQWEGRQIKVTEDRGSKPAGERRGPGGGGGYASQDSQNSDGGRPSMGYFRAQPFVLDFRRRKKLDPFIEDKKLVIDYKDPRLLRRFVSERGRVLPRRMTGLTSAHQRQVRRAVKRAQHLALLPFTGN